MEKENKELTQRQWMLKGYVLNKNAKGKERWTNCVHQVKAVYYSADEVHEDVEATKKFFSEERRKAREARKQREKERIEFEEYRSSMSTEFQWLYRLNRIPNEDAEWIEGSILNARWHVAYASFAEGYYYCHEDDTHEPKDENELKLAREEREKRIHQKWVKKQQRLADMRGYSETLMFDPWPEAETAAAADGNAKSATGNE